jgi:hypothetical protein
MKLVIVADIHGNHDAVRALPDVLLRFAVERCTASVGSK